MNVTINVSIDTKKFTIQLPIRSMYGICIYVWLKFVANEGTHFAFWAVDHLLMLIS